MPTAKKAKVPKHCLLKPRGLAYVRIRGRVRYLGKYGTPESREAYGRLVAELATQPDLTPAAASGNVVGLGAAFNSDHRVEFDAAIMEGTMIGRGEGKQDPRKRVGAVAAVTHVKNPISAARAVMEMEGSRHVLLVGDGAERFALGDANRAKYHIEAVSNLYFWTDRRLRQIRGRRHACDDCRIAR